MNANSTGRLMPLRPKRAIGMVVAPAPVSLALLLFSTLPLDSLTVLFLPIAAPRAFFTLVPIVIITPVSVVIALVLFLAPLLAPLIITVPLGLRGYGQHQS